MRTFESESENPNPEQDAGTRWREQVIHHPYAAYPPEAFTTEEMPGMPRRGEPGVVRGEVLVPGRGTRLTYDERGVGMTEKEIPVYRPQSAMENRQAGIPETIVAEIATQWGAVYNEINKARALAVEAEKNAAMQPGLFKKSDLEIIGKLRAKLEYATAVFKEQMGKQKASRLIVEKMAFGRLGR